ncbi:MAG: efflux RND transporter periplasmic adaptor subunit [candidate division Zixibacteria bacterium]|nr:efflux RND transporter periplasmic adaptor subunit [candidate division Zixibacteria bacterium]
MTKKKKKIIIFSAIGLVIVLFIAVNLMSSGEKSFTVQTDKVLLSDITSTVAADGKMEAETQVKISAYVPAKIVSLPVEEGDQVRKGQLLVQLDHVAYKAAVDQSKATLESNRARLRIAETAFEQTELIYNRQKQLYEQKLSSQQEFDAARADYNGSLAEVESNRYLVAQAEASLVQATDNLSKTTITSPINGVVTDLNAEVGEIVLVGTMNNPGTVILTVSDLSKIEAEVDVDETDVANVRLGQDAKIRVDALPDTSFNGVVTEIAGTGKVEALGTQNQSTNFKVKVLLKDNVLQVKPGMTCSVDITTNHHPQVLNVPIQAVVIREVDQDSLLAMTGDKKPETKKNANSSEAVAATDVASKATSDTSSKKGKAKKQEVEGVFVVKDGKAEFVPVKIGISDKQNVEVSTGLSKDTEVITGSYRILRTLKDGDSIKPDNSGKQGDKPS